MVNADQESATGSHHPLDCILECCGVVVDLLNELLLHSNPCLRYSHSWIRNNVPGSVNPQAIACTQTLQSNVHLPPPPPFSHSRTHDFSYLGFFHNRLFDDGDIFYYTLFDHVGRCHSCVAFRINLGSQLMKGVGIG